MMIYIVQGMTGEYSDSIEWLVKAYRSQYAAEEHARKAMLRAMEIHKARPTRFHPSEGVNEFDPNCAVMYSVTEYTVLEVELDEDTK